MDVWFFKKRNKKLELSCDRIEIEKQFEPKWHTRSCVSRILNFSTWFIFFLLNIPGVPIDPLWEAPLTDDYEEDSTIVE